MNDIVINPLESKYYQPNIVVAIFLALYKSAEITFSKKNLGNFKIEFSDFINKLMDSVQAEKYSNYDYDNEYTSIISKKEDEDNITLYIDKNKYAKLNNKSKISYMQQFLLYLKKYLSLLKTDDLHDDKINMPSWETLSSNFINSIDKSRNPKDYKIFDFEHIQAITYYFVNANLIVKKVEIELLPNKNNSILEESAWNINITLSLKTFFQYINYNTTKTLTVEHIKPVKYSTKEQRVINLVNNWMEEEGCKIPPENILEAINSEWYIGSETYKNYKKYVSNFISRLNKKYQHNTGHKLFYDKDFKDCYLAHNYYEEFGEY